MAIDVTKLSVEQLRNLIRNHEEGGATDRPIYEEALAEQQKRLAGTLSIDRTVRAILAAGKARKFITYGDLAAANGAKWDEVRYPMFQHLGLVLKHAHSKGAPMLTAIVVEQGSRQTGEMNDYSLRGFVTAARELGVRVTDERAFLKEQQDATFAFAAEHSSL